MSTASTDQRFIIGIDLGTTNSAVSYVDLQQSDPARKRIQIFQVPQLTGPGEINQRPVLPSFLYLPGEYDLAPEAVVHPWPVDASGFAGSFARDHGAKVPARLVSSAKSWLCHANVDRHARILPWGADEELYKVSPVQATAAYLKHVRLAWNTVWGADESQHLEHQLIIVTVPASFDEVARELTLEAAKMAGLKQVTLLEEPLAAFYSWLRQHEKDWNASVQPGELILVCDVGGGTTDFTLITLRESEGSPRFERIAVGDHLILGGDNVDLALARQVETHFKGARQSLSSDRWKALCHQCRQAKERILSGKAQSQQITLMGEGSRLIAGTLSAELDSAEVERIVLEGFFPLIEAGTPPRIAARQGITEFGLPYEREPAITRHLGWFLEQHQPDIQRVLQRSSCAPDLVLFNGGSLKPTKIQERIRAALRHWFKESDSRRPRMLPNPDPDLAVALGAAYYGLVKIGEGVRVGSGSPRSFYLGVARAVSQDAAQGRQEALCIVERGLEEGSSVSLADKSFDVLTNQPVVFHLYSSSYRSGDQSGELVAVDDTLTTLPPLQTIIQYGKKGARTAIPVTIEATFTEMGTLALWCRSQVSSHRWQLQFQLRDMPTAETVSDQEVFEASLVEAAQQRLKHAFATSDPKRQLETLVKDLSQVVQRAREDWPLSFIRILADDLLDLQAVRTNGPLYEGRWMNLVGFCLRPGLGEGFDEARLRRLWKLHKAGPAHANQAQVRSEWWIMWRRVAAGLNPGQQRQFLQEVTPLLKGEGKRLPPQERLELWMAAANLEKIYGKDKVKLGDQLLAELNPKKAKPQHLWALGRLGARELLYGPADRTIPPREAARWIEQLLVGPWSNAKAVGMALSQLARRTGDRSRDLDQDVRQQVMTWLSQHNAPAQQQRCVAQIVPMARQEQTALFGESLPAGIILHA